MELDIKELKINGFLQQVDEEFFDLRIRVVAGQLTAEKLIAVSQLAKEYGRGEVHLTSRQGVEIPFIKKESIPEVKEFLKIKGLEPGILGARVRTITACQGADICKHGKIGTTDLARKVTDATMDIELPHKFKIGITGCCNNCLKAEENDLGIKGGIEPKWQSEKCTFCGACQFKCPAGAITVDKDNYILKYSKKDCVYCGKCVTACTKKAWTGKNGYLIYFGGTFGNKILIGQRILPIIFSSEEVIEIVLKALKFYQEQGKKGQRIGFILEGKGIQELKKFLVK